MFHTKKHSSGHAQSELAIVFFFSGEGLSFHWVSCISWTIFKPLHPNWPLLLYDHGSCANINRKKTYHWYLLIQTIDWNSVQKLQQNHGIEQDSPVTYPTSTLDAVETRPFSRSSGHSAFHCPCASRTSLGQRLPCPASCRDWSRPPWAFHLGRELRFRDFTEGKKIMENRNIYHLTNLTDDLAAWLERLGFEKKTWIRL